MKSIIHKLLLIALSLNIVLLHSCKKDEPTSGPTSMHGFVISDTDGKKIAGADVWLVQVGDGISSLSDKTLAYKKTNTDGYYNFDFDAEDGKKYYIAVQAKHHFKKEVNNFSNGKNTKIDINLSPKGYVQIAFINTPPKETVEISVNILPLLSSTLEKDTIMIGEWFGNQNLELTWWIKNGMETSLTKFQESIYVKALDTTNFTLKY